MGVETPIPPVVMNTAAPEGTPPRRINDYPKASFPRFLDAIGPRGHFWFCEDGGQGEHPLGSLPLWGSEGVTLIILEYVCRYFQKGHDCSTKRGRANNQVKTRYQQTQSLQAFTTRIIIT